jgi:hypothetical protein
MKRLFLSCLFVGALVSSSACKPSVATLGLAVNAFQSVVMVEQAAGMIPAADATKAIQWCVNADTLLLAAKSGWPAALQSSWAVFVTQIPAKDMADPTLAAAVTSLTAMLATLT